MSGVPGEVTRRSLIQWALLLVGIAPVALIGCVSRRIPSDTSRRVQDALERLSESTPLSTVEIGNLVAFGEVLVEGRTLTTSERRYLIEHIEDRTTRSLEYLSLYRGTAASLDRLAGRAFASLEVHERIDLIARHRLAGPVRAGEDLGPSRAARDLIGSYYGSPAGWAIVGYDSFPGRCGGLTRYSRPEG